MVWRYWSTLKLFVDDERKNYCCPIRAQRSGHFRMLQLRISRCDEDMTNDLELRLGRRKSASWEASKNVEVVKKTKNAWFRHLFDSAFLQHPYKPQRRRHMEAEEDGQRGKERKHGARSSAEVREALLPKRCSKADTMSLRPFRLKLGGAIMQTASNQDTMWNDAVWFVRDACKSASETRWCRR